MGRPLGCTPALGGGDKIACSVPSRTVSQFQKAARTRVGLISFVVIHCSAKCRAVFVRANGQELAVDALCPARICCAGQSMGVLSSMRVVAVQVQGPPPSLQSNDAPRLSRASLLSYATKLYGSLIHVIVVQAAGTSHNLPEAAWYLHH